MQYELIRGTFIKRYKRFFADVQLANGDIVTAHCPNTGTMYSLLNEGVDAWILPNDNPKRKLKYTLCFLALPNGGRALVNTMWPNRIVEDGIAAGEVKELRAYKSMKREQKYGENSRIDILLDENPRRQGPCYVEVKNVTMLSDLQAERADFPDAKTERGAKHLAELTKLAQAGIRCVQFYLMSRSDCTSVSLDKIRDPNYAAAAKKAKAAGVEFLAYDCVIDDQQIVLGKKIPCRF
ncbi:MAG: DNA/RNA nuclease SfsA [Planctomycetes bacterium]|nr:DNA/RNA nuclease SfsA [Planctomycetota bacterium]